MVERPEREVHVNYNHLTKVITNLSELHGVYGELEKSLLVSKKHCRENLVAREVCSLVIDSEVGSTILMNDHLELCSCWEHQVENFLVGILTFERL